MTPFALAAITHLAANSPRTLDSRLDTLSDLLHELVESPSLHLRRQVLTVASEVLPIHSEGYEHLRRSTLLLLDGASLPIADADKESTT